MLALLAGQSGAAPSPVAVSNVVDSVSLQPDGGTSLSLGRGAYEGSLEITPYAAGLAVVEETTIDGYLLGITEVPTSWPDETLAAQTVAARSYLAWTLFRGRSINGTKYDYDICASQYCQVYRGTAGAADSWAAAVTRTNDEILIYDGQPAQALYSSSAGSRTRSNQDIWGGSAVPYLQAVDSPEDGYTPYERWRLTVSAEEFSRVFNSAGYWFGERIDDVTLESPGEGNGPEHVKVRSELGVTSIRATDFREVFNVHGPELYPGLMPAARPAGGRWPQTILSYTFSVEYEPPVRAALPFFPPGDAASMGTLTIIGEGWGHGIGMSQWGAMALGSAGVSYQSILDHYYGLAPRDGGAMLPDSVRVGLFVEEPRVSLTADGPFALRAPGYDTLRLPGGEYSFWWAGDGLVVVAHGVGLVDSPLFLTRRQQPR